MSNLSITLECNRKCTYCFAPPLSQEIRMDLGIYRESLELLKRSGIDQVRLLGGEPTLHPEFSQFISCALEQGFRILVFSNGLMPEKALKSLMAAPSQKIAVLVNINSPECRSEAEDLHLDETLRSLAGKAMPSCTIYNPAPDLDFLIPLIEKHQLRRSIRLGLAHPNKDAINSFIHPKHYHGAGKIIVDFAVRCADHKVSIEFDCGFVPCMFPEGFLKRFSLSPDKVGLRCGPVPDITPDGGIIHCYSLPSISLSSLHTDETVKDLRARIESGADSYRKIGVYAECRTCPLREAGHCKGGCLAAAMLRVRNSSHVFTIQRGSTRNAGHG